MRPGLPAELAEPALVGLSRTAILPAGAVTVDRGAYDPVESSPLIIELAAELLGRVLSLGVTPSEAHVTEWLDALR